MPTEENSKSSSFHQKYDKNRCHMFMKGNVEGRNVGTAEQKGLFIGLPILPYSSTINWGVKVYSSNIHHKLDETIWQKN